jgi:hypothetical protein
MSPRPSFTRRSNTLAPLVDLTTRNSWPTSVWSTVPQLCLHEKGYSEDEYIVKLVDIGESPTRFNVWSQCLLGFAGKGEVCEWVDQVAHSNGADSLPRTFPRPT